MRTVGMNFVKDNGAGYYSSEVHGSHDTEHIAMYFDGNDKDVEPPAFSYWHDDTPECDEYWQDPYAIEPTAEDCWDGDETSKL